MSCNKHFIALPIHCSFLPVPAVAQGSVVFLNFDIGTDEAVWRLKIVKEDCSENIPRTIFGEMTCLYDPVIYN